MRRATITLPDDLEAEVEAYLGEQEAPPSLTALLQAALRHFLGERRADREARRGYAWRSPSGPEPSEIAEEAGVYEVGGARSGALVGMPLPWLRSSSEPPTLADLPALLASLPRLSESEAGELADDLERAREELAHQELSDPWARPVPDGGSADEVG